MEVQQTLLRFSDEYLIGMAYGTDRLRRGTNAPDPAEILKWKILLGTQTCSIVSGPNAMGNLLDMMVFVTVTRMALEEYWQPKVFGESVLPMLETCRNAETKIWRFAGQVLTSKKLAELHQAIEEWCRGIRGRRMCWRRGRWVSPRKWGRPARPQDPDRQRVQPAHVDPLSGLDPAVRELAQTRLFAERALFVTQQMPTMLRWQTEFLSLNAVEMPTVQQLVTNTTQIADFGGSFRPVAEKLPGQVSAEREEILKALQSQEKNVSSLMTTGTQMSDSLNTTLTTFTR